MSDETDAKKGDQNQSGLQDEHSQQQQHSPQLALPSTGSDSIKLDMSGGSSTVKLDHLGPLVVNENGTLSRISNWDQMADIEKKNTLRVLWKRNQLRLARLKEAGVQIDFNKAS